MGVYECVIKMRSFLFTWLISQANIKEGSSFNFLNFLSRAFDDDFEQVVGIK